MLTNRRRMSFGIKKISIFIKTKAPIFSFIIKKIFLKGLTKKIVFLLSQKPQYFHL